ncbi:MAG: hypothetical protein ACR2GF_02630 [Acidimicrobiales bacterium]
MADPLRFLLDQNFPEVEVLDPHSVDRSVEYVHIRQWRPDLVANVPDWLIYFEAELASFTGVVTKDWHQSVQAEEAFAIAHTKPAVVTWRSPPDDPVVEWAMVIAYMPEVKKILAGRRDPPFIFLPSPHLDSRNVRKRDEALGLLAKERAISNAQARREAHASIVEHLTTEGLRQELFDLANRKSNRRAPGSLVSQRSPAKKIPPAASPPLPA